MIVRYLKRTREFGTIVKPTGDLSLDCYVDADFAGLHRVEKAENPVSARSRAGFIVIFGGYPLIWRSQLMTEIHLSTASAEYSALSHSLRALLPIRSLIVEAAHMLGISEDLRSTIRCRTFEDNNAALTLATQQRLTSRTKYFLTKWHFFWQFVRNAPVQAEDEYASEQALESARSLPVPAHEGISPPVDLPVDTDDDLRVLEILPIDTTLQRADYFTKALVREIFERIRKLVQGW